MIQSIYLLFFKRSDRYETRCSLQPYVLPNVSCNMCIHYSVFCKDLSIPIRFLIFLTSFRCTFSADEIAQFVNIRVHFRNIATEDAMLFLAKHGGVRMIIRNKKKKTIIFFRQAVRRYFHFD